MTNGQRDGVRRLVQLGLSKFFSRQLVLDRLRMNAFPLVDARSDEEQALCRKHGERYRTALARIALETME